jgi:hypothetical protein
MNGIRVAIFLILTALLGLGCASLQSNHELWLEGAERCEKYKENENAFNMCLAVLNRSFLKEGPAKETAETGSKGPSPGQPVVAQVNSIGHHLSGAADARRQLEPASSVCQNDPDGLCVTGHGLPTGPDADVACPIRNGQSLGMDGAGSPITVMVDMNCDGRLEPRAIVCSPGDVYFRHLDPGEFVEVAYLRRIGERLWPVDGVGTQTTVGYRLIKKMTYRQTPGYSSRRSTSYYTQGSGCGG